MNKSEPPEAWMALLTIPQVHAPDSLWHQELARQAMRVPSLQITLSYQLNNLSCWHNYKLFILFYNFGNVNQTEDHWSRLINIVKYFKVVVRVLIGQQAYVPWEIISQFEADYRNKSYIWRKFVYCALSGPIISQGKPAIL